jgi:hypothetical protein
MPCSIPWRSSDLAFVSANGSGFAALTAAASPGREPPRRGWGADGSRRCGTVGVPRVISPRASTARRRWHCRIAGGSCIATIVFRGEGREHLKGARSAGARVAHAEALSPGRPGRPRRSRGLGAGRSPGGRRAERGDIENFVAMIVPGALRPASTCWSSRTRPSRHADAAPLRPRAGLAPRAAASRRHAGTRTDLREPLLPPPPRLRRRRAAGTRGTRARRPRRTHDRRWVCSWPPPRCSPGTPASPCARTSRAGGRLAGWVRVRAGYYIQLAGAGRAEGNRSRAPPLGRAWRSRRGAAQQRGMYCDSRAMLTTACFEIEQMLVLASQQPAGRQRARRARRCRPPTCAWRRPSSPPRLRRALAGHGLS